MADNSELMTDLKSCPFCARAYVSCSNSKCKVFTPVTEAGEVSEAIEREANFILDRLDDLVIDWDDDESYRQFSGHVVPSMERLRHLLAARRVQPKQQDDARDSTVGAEAWPVGDAYVTWYEPQDTPKPGKLIDCSLAVIDRAKIGDRFYSEAQVHSIVAASLASARADGVREGLEQAAKVAEEVGAFGDYRRDELTLEYGKPRFDLMNGIIAAIRALINKDAGGDRG